MGDYVSKQKLLEWIKERKWGIHEDRQYARKEGLMAWKNELTEKIKLLNDVKNEIQSGAFDTPEPTYPTPDAYEAACHALWKHRDEIQRLRAALVKARAVMEDALSVGEATYEDFDIKLNPWADLSMGVEEINKTLYQTPTEPSGEEREGDLIGYWINEKCPKCGADMLVNKVGDKWCSLVGCDYSINAPEKVGTEEWRHKYFGAEWPKVEGDGNDA